MALRLSPPPRSIADPVLQRWLESLYQFVGANVAVPVLASLFDANTVIKADTDATPAALTIGEGELLGRLSGGTIDALTASQVRSLLSLVPGADVQAYDADLAALAGIAGVSGDIIYHNGTQWTRLAKGSNSQVLTLASGLPSWAANSGTSKLVFQTTLTASSDTNLAWSSLTASDRRMILRFRNVLPATDDVEAHLTLTEGGTRQTGASDYQWTFAITRSDSTASAITSDNSAAEVRMSASASGGFAVANTSGTGFTGTVIVENPASTTLRRYIDFRCAYRRGGADALQRVEGNGVYVTTGTAVDGFDFRFSSGNVASGEIDVYSEIV